MPIDRLNKVMRARPVDIDNPKNYIGMGQSGETFLVGADYTMRSNSRLTAGEDVILSKKVETATVKEALAKEAGVGIVVDYRSLTPLRENNKRAISYDVALLLFLMLIGLSHI